MNELLETIFDWHSAINSTGVIVNGESNVGKLDEQVFVLKVDGELFEL